MQLNNPDDDNKWTLGMTVVELAAEKKGVSPLELPPLYYTVDPDALNRFVDSMDGGSVRFPYAGLDITVRPPRNVTIADGE